MSKYLVHYGVKGMKWGKHLFGQDDRVTITHPDGGASSVPNTGSTYKNTLNAVRSYSRSFPEKASGMKRKKFIVPHETDKNNITTSRYHKKRQSDLKKRGLKALAAFENQQRNASIRDVKKGRAYNRGRELLRFHMYGRGTTEV